MKRSDQKEFKQGRQERALERLENQLKVGKVGPKMDQVMTPEHKTRIEGEIKILKGKLGKAV